MASQFGLEPSQTLRALSGLPRYLRDYARFRFAHGERVTLLPCLHDFGGNAGNIRSEYFWQDLYVAQKIFQSKPYKHIDVGSRVDGFVAHVASFREVELLDIRPMEVSIPGVTFKRTDIMAPPADLHDYCDSLSCLHALEHFGLGRYGDPIDPQGHERGFRNLARMLTQHGIFYLSVPVGRARVEFNAHRVLDPRTILRWAEESSLFLRSFAAVGGDGLIAEADSLSQSPVDLKQVPYVLGIFIFRKESRPQ